MQKRLVFNFTYRPDVTAGKAVRFDEDPQIGDYPNLPFENHQTRAPTGYDDVQGRTNFGETVHEEDEVLNVWSPDLYDKPGGEAAKELFIGLSALGLAMAFIAYSAADPPAVRREYPYNGLEKELVFHPARASEEE